MHGSFGWVVAVAVLRLASPLTSTVFGAMALIGSACGGDDGRIDGTAPDAGSDATELFSPPEIPWLEDGVPPSMLGPCPDGWSADVDEHGVTTCDPHPSGAPTSCPDGEAHFVGEPGCRPIGSPCPTGDWPSDLPADEATIVFVRAGATAGDGSRSAPYGSLDDVPWSVRGSGWTVALAKGSYDGALPLREGVHVVGACAAETIIGAPTLASEAVITVNSGGDAAVVQDVSIVDAAGPGILVRSGQSVSLAGVSVRGATGAGLVAAGVGTMVEATDLLIEDTLPRADGNLGSGVLVEDGASFSATRFNASGNRDVAVLATDVGTTVTLTDTALHDTQPQASDGQGGRGLSAQEGAQLTATRIWISRNHELGLYARDTGTVVTLDRAVVRDTRAEDMDARSGRGIGVFGGAHLGLSGLSLSGNLDTGILAADPGTTVMITDSVIRDTLAATDAMGGRALHVADGAHLEAERLAITRSREAAVVAGIDGTVSLSDVLVRDTQVRQSDGLFGAGLLAGIGGRIDGTRILVTNVHHFGVLASSPDSMVALTDVVIRDLRPDESGSLSGIGVVALLGARVEATRVRVNDAVGIGIFSSDDDSTFVGRDVEVGSVLRTASSEEFGHGAAAVAAAMTLDRFLIRDSESCGLFVGSWLGQRGELDVSHGVVERSTVGACVQVDEYELGRLTQDVVFRDNATNLESTVLPVPEPPQTIEL